MKFKKLLSMVMVVLVMTNCNQDEYQDEILQQGFSEFTADVEGQSQSRSTMTDGGKFSWATGDQISVWNGSGFVTFTCTNGNTFSGNGTTPSKYAVYPAGYHTISGNNVTVSLPSSYGNQNSDYVKNTNAIMLASVQQGNSNLTFKHLGGLMRFNIKNVPAGANKFVFTASDKRITGAFPVEDDIITAEYNNGNNTVTINFKALSSSKDMTFYIPLPTGTYNGFKIEIKGNNTTLDYTSTVRNTINRRSLLLMPTFVCNNGNLNKQESASVDFSNNSNTTTTITTESVEVKTATATGNSSAKLSYNPSSQPTLNLMDDNKDGATQESKATVNVEVPANSTVTALTVNAPTLTVELSADNSGKATYETVTAKTAANTLKINQGITINRLILNGGHIVIESGAKVDRIEKANGYNEKTYIVNKGTITNIPVLDNVEIVTNENQIQQGYVLRVLTFEDKDAKFSPYRLEYAGVDINTWSNLIDEPQYSGPLTYATGMGEAEYTWYDEGNTELYHMFPDNYGCCYWGGGHAISNYWGAGYSNDDRDRHIANYYGEEYVENNAGNDAMLGWFNVQWMVPVAPHSGNNFAVHYGYKDFFSYIENLPEISFGDGNARVIDHMYVCNTNYTLNQLVCGVGSEAGNTFGGSWTGLSNDAWLKIVAYGYDSFDADPTTDDPTSTAEFYLVNGNNVVEDWQKWDLSELGEVAKVRFNFLYSDAMGGTYGFTIPGYFAYDDIAVRFEE